jgi:hypothetical protein
VRLSYNINQRMRAWNNNRTGKNKIDEVIISGWYDDHNEVYIRKSTVMIMSSVLFEEKDKIIENVVLFNKNRNLKEYKSLYTLDDCLRIGKIVCMKTLARKRRRKNAEMERRVRWGGRGTCCCTLCQKSRGMGQEGTKMGL